MNTKDDAHKGPLAQQRRANAPASRHLANGGTIADLPATDRPRDESPRLFLERARQVRENKAGAPLHFENGGKSFPFPARLLEAPDLLGQLSGLDRCLVSLLMAAAATPMSVGRLAHLASELFAEVSVNLVRERMAAIRAVLERHELRDFLQGDDAGGFYMSA